MPRRKIEDKPTRIEKRLSSGIYGLDDMCEGGFLPGRSILVTGGAGTGKTIFSMQYAVNAIEGGEAVVYVTLDERPELLRQDMLKFGWDLKKYEDQGKLAIIDVSAATVGITSKERYALPTVGIDVDRLLTRIMQIIEEIGATRIVIDSISGLGMHIESDNEMRKTLLKINYMLGEIGVSSLISSQVEEESATTGQVSFSKYKVEEYVADGVIVLHYLGIGTESNRSLFIRKMRGTKHIEDILPMQITPKGIVVKKPEEAYKI